MNLRKEQSSDLFDTVHYCYSMDQSLREFSRNSECDLDERIKREVDCLKFGDMTFYKVYDDKKFVGYFGYETQPILTLTTFFIMPEFRARKDEIFNYMVQDLDKTFYAGLFDVNIRAKRFFEKQGGKPIISAWVEDKPSTIYEFKR